MWCYLVPLVILGQLLRFCPFPVSWEVVSLPLLARGPQGRHCANTPEQQLKHLYVINTVAGTDPKYSSTWIAMRKFNSIPAIPHAMLKTIVTLPTLSSLPIESPLQWWPVPARGCLGTRPRTKEPPSALSNFLQPVLYQASILRPHSP